MPTHFRAIVWIDHWQARIFHIGLSGEDEVVLHPHLPTRHPHHKANTIGNGHAAPDRKFLARIMDAVTAKTELAKYLRRQDARMGGRIVAVEAADQPTDGELIAYAGQLFGMGPTRAGTVRGPISG